MKRKFFAVFALCFGIMGSCNTFAMEKTNTELFYLGRDTKLDNPIYVEGNSYYIPLRECAEQIGATVDYVPNSMIMITSPENREIKYYLNKNEALINDSIKQTTKGIKNINGVSYVEVNEFYQFFILNVAESEENGIKTLRVTDDYKTTNKEYKKSDFNNSLLLLNAITQNGAASPISLKMALAMVANGATGQTQQEVLKFLGYNTVEEMNQSINDILKWTVYPRNANNSEGILCFANSLWNMEGQDFSETFQNSIKSNFNGVTNTVTKETAVQVINEWAKGVTKGMLPEVIQQANFDTALINATYFKCTWFHQFQAENNRKDIFNNIDNTRTEIDFMNIINEAYYCESKGWQMLGIPYSDTNYYMYFFLPEKGNQQPLDNETINRLLQFQENMDVKITIPKFTIENSLRLQETLKASGIHSMFENISDFNTMYANGQGKLLTDVIQKVKIIVDEQGTEAAAVTEITFGRGIDMTTPPEFKADRPFTYMLTKDTAGQKEVLFIGQYVTGK